MSSTLILRDTDTFSCEIAWLVDTRACVDIHALMAKVAGREDRQRDERRMLLVQSKNVGGQ